MRRSHYLIGSLLILITLISSANSARIENPRGVFYYHPAASLFGFESVWVNPAGLARYPSSGFQLMADYSNGDYAKSWGGVLARDRLAMAYRNLDNPGGDNFQEWILATGFALGELNVGGSYRYYKSGPDGFDNRHSWNIGLMSQTGGPFSWAAGFNNLNQAKDNGRQTETEMAYSIGYRPFDESFTLAVDMFLSTGTKFNDADFVYHADYAVMPGLNVNGFIDSDENYQIGFRVNLLQYIVGSRTRFEPGGHNGRTTVFYGATSLRQPSVIKERPRRLSLSISGSVGENPAQPFFHKKPTAFVELIQNLYRAADDPSIGEMVIKLNRVAFRFGHAQEVRDALSYFRSQGKWIVCHVTSPNNIAYYIASVADEILIPPVSQLNLVGLRAELTFYAETLDKLGIKMDFVRIGDYKTAPESFTRKESTEANREQINRILDDLYDQFVTGIADGRNIRADSVRTIIDAGPFTSVEAQKFGLIDGLSYVDQISDYSTRQLPEISFRKYQTDTLANEGWPSKPLVAIVVAQGDIAFDSKSASPFDRRSSVTPKQMKRAFASALGNRSVRGVVFRIDSPGGFALAGEDILHATSKVQERMPLVTSMANLAASGGYYIAMSSEKLFANPGTITGSIGIYGGKADLSGLYEKIGLGKELYVRGRNAAMMTSIKPFSPEERVKYRSQLESFYAHFVDLVAANRSLVADSVDNLARGRVWTGREALDNGLVDEIGGIKASLDYVAQRAGLEDYRTVIYPKRKRFFVLPGSSLISSVVKIFTGSRNDVSLPDQLLSTDFEGVMARMPYDLSIE